MDAESGASVARIFVRYVGISAIPRGKVRGPVALSSDVLFGASFQKAHISGSGELRPRPSVRLNCDLVLNSVRLCCPIPAVRHRNTWRAVGSKGRPRGLKHGHYPIMTRGHLGVVIIRLETAVLV